VLVGAVVAIPTFPPVVKILPMVFELNVADKPPPVTIKLVIVEEVTIKLLAVIVPVNLILPSVTVIYAGEISIVLLLAGSAILLFTTASPTAVKIDNSELQQTARIPLAGVVCVVQVIPSEDDITLLVPSLDTATNIDNSGDQNTLCQLLSCGVARVVQVIPSGDVITRCPAVVLLTDTNKYSSGDQVTQFQLSSLVVLVVQVIPSGDVMTRFRVPLLETATNNPNSAAQTTLFHVLSAADTRVVQVVPLGDVITRLPVPL